MEVASAELAVPELAIAETKVAEPVAMEVASTQTAKAELAVAETQTALAELAAVETQTAEAAKAEIETQTALAALMEAEMQTEAIKSADRELQTDNIESAEIELQTDEIESKDVDLQLAEQREELERAHKQQMRAYRERLEEAHQQEIEELERVQATVVEELERAQATAVEELERAHEAQDGAAAASSPVEVIKEVRVEVPIEARQEVQVEETAAAVAAAVAAERARLEEEKAAAIAAAVAAERAKAPVASYSPPADEAVKPVDRDPSAAASTSELAQPPPAVVAATVEAERRAEEAEQQVADAEEIIARLEEELATVRAAEPESVDSVRSVFTKDAGWVEVSVSSEAEIRARAAVKMQASFRAKKARKEVEAMKEEKRTGKKPMPNLNQKPRYLQSSGPPPNRERRGSTKEAPNLDQLPRYLQPKEGGGPSKSEEARARRASIAERRKSVAPGPASQAAAKLPKRRASIAPAPPAAAAKQQPALPPTIEEPPAAAAAAPPPPPPARPPPEPPALPPRPKTSDAQPPRSRAPRLPAHLEKYSVARPAPARPQTARADEREQQDTEPPKIPRKAEPLRRPAPPTEFLHTPREASDETPEIVHVEPEEEVEEPEPEPEKPPLVVAVSTSMDNTAPVANQEHVQQTMISLSVPKVRSSERAPISVVAVVDNSGSMDVNLRSLKTSLAFLVRHGLDERDKLGLVIFGNEATVEMPLTVLDDAGKQLAIASIEGMVAEGKTNLSGAVLAGLDLLGGEAGDEATKALMVFTDSKTNRGTKAAASLVAECREQVEDAGMAGDVMINTMGYGYDHNERQLRELADAFGGKYYFIEDPRLIPDAINDCMGGLVNVAGQQAELIVEADPSGGDVRPARDPPSVDDGR